MLDAGAAYMTEQKHESLKHECKGKGFLWTRVGLQGVPFKSPYAVYVNICATPGTFKAKFGNLIDLRLSAEFKDKLSCQVYGSFSN